MTEAIEFYVIPIDDLVELVRIAEGGNPDAQDLRMAISSAMQVVIKKAATRKPAMCLCCDHAFSRHQRPPHAFGIAKPMFPDRTQKYEAIACGICADCLTRPDLQAAMIAALREGWPEADFRETSLQ